VNPVADQARDDAIAQVRRWYWMRMSSMLLAVCVLVHLATVIYAVRGGLSAADILGRTRGSLPFAAFYAVFVLSCAIHVPIGLATVVEEWSGAGPRVARLVSWAAALIIAVLGLRAVYAVVA
jgi:fumarate reductase subunit C